MSVHRTMIVPAEMVEIARHVAATLSPGGVGMFKTAVSSDPLPPLPEDPMERVKMRRERAPLATTHYISCGEMNEQFVALMQSGVALYNAAVSVAASRGIEFRSTLQQCEDLVQASIVSTMGGGEELKSRGWRITN